MRSLLAILTFVAILAPLSAKAADLNVLLKGTSKTTAPFAYADFGCKALGNAKVRCTASGAIRAMQHFWLPGHAGYPPQVCTLNIQSSGGKWHATFLKNTAPCTLHWINDNTLDVEVNN